MSYLFEPRQNFDVQLIARFLPTDVEVNPIDVPLSYNSASATLMFDIPNMVNGKSYYIQYIRREIPNDSILAHVLQLGSSWSA